jgi:hypothetical protein
MALIAEFENDIRRERQMDGIAKVRISKRPLATSRSEEHCTKPLRYDLKRTSVAVQMHDKEVLLYHNCLFEVRSVVGIEMTAVKLNKLRV